VVGIVKETGDAGMVGVWSKEKWPQPKK
jgi:hypothetical protein